MWSMVLLLPSFTSGSVFVVPWSHWVCCFCSSPYIGNVDLCNLRFFCWFAASRYLSVGVPEASRSCDPWFCCYPRSHLVLFLLFLDLIEFVAFVCRDPYIGNVDLCNPRFLCWIAASRYLSLVASCTHKLLHNVFHGPAATLVHIWVCFCCSSIWLSLLLLFVETPTLEMCFFLIFVFLLICCI